MAVEFSQRSDLSPVIGKIFNGLVMAYGYEGDDSGRQQLLMNSNKCLLSLVMKLSEAQLRPLYARLREWRGDIQDSSEGQSSAVRRHAFWSLSAELSRSLRSIFLPCLTSVLPDVIDELVSYVAVMALNLSSACPSAVACFFSYHAGNCRFFVMPTNQKNGRVKATSCGGIRCFKRAYGQSKTLATIIALPRICP